MRPEDFCPRTLDDLLRQAPLCCGADPQTKSGNLHAQAAELIVGEITPRSFAAPAGTGGWLDAKTIAKFERAEQKRIHKAVVARMRQNVVGFDPFTWLTIASLVWRVLKLIWDWWHREPSAAHAITAMQTVLAVSQLKP